MWLTQPLCQSTPRTAKRAGQPSLDRSCAQDPWRSAVVIMAAAASSLAACQLCRWCPGTHSSLGPGQGRSPATAPALMRRLCKRVAACTHLEGLAQSQKFPIHNPALHCSPKSVPCGRYSYHCCLPWGLILGGMPDSPHSSLCSKHACRPSCLRA